MATLELAATSNDTGLTFQIATMTTKSLVFHLLAYGSGSRNCIARVPGMLCAYAYE
jgi:hypothetical protein